MTYDQLVKDHNVPYLLAREIMDASAGDGQVVLTLDELVGWMKRHAVSQAAVIATKAIDLAEDEIRTGGAGWANSCAIIRGRLKRDPTPIIPRGHQAEPE